MRRIEFPRRRHILLTQRRYKRRLHVQRRLVERPNWPKRIMRTGLMVTNPLDKIAVNVRPDWDDDRMDAVRLLHSRTRTERPNVKRAYRQQWEAGWESVCRNSIYGAHPPIDKIFHAPDPNN